MTLVIPHVEVLDAAEEVRLARAIEAGLLAADALETGRFPAGATAQELAELVAAGTAAHQGFFLANLRLVARLAHQWARRSQLPAEELFQEGCVGLGEAIRRWDHRLGLKFSTIAFPRVEWAISAAALLRCGDLEITRHAARSALVAKRAAEKLASAHGRPVSPAEVAEHLGRDVVAVARSLQLQPADSLSDELVNTIAEPEPAISAALPEPSGQEWLDRLPGQEQTVLRGRYGIGQPAVSPDQLAAKLGVSQSTIRRIEQRALNRIRRMLQAA